MTLRWVWGLYHYRVDYPETDNSNWFAHVQLKKNDSGEMVCFKRDIDPYIVELNDSEKDAYNKLRITSNQGA